jgi:hypothetical protein
MAVLLFTALLDFNFGPFFRLTVGMANLAAGPILGVKKAGSPLPALWR